MKENTPMQEVEIMSCFKVLLISLYNDESYGLRILHSILVSQGYDARMLFLKINKNSNLTLEEKELFFNFLKEFEPDLVTFSLVSPNFMLYKELYSKIMTIGNFKILIGGWQASLNPEETIKYCDYLCIGEGEEAILELVCSLAKEEKPFDIPNIWFNRKYTIVKNEVRLLNKNLDDYPFCLIDNKYSYFIENNELVNKEPYFFNSRYGIMLSRGCPYHCTYCSNSYMDKEVYPKEWSKMRYRSVEHVMNELRQVKKLLPNIKQINFYDEIFIPKKEWLKEFFSKYKKEINLPFYCMFYPGTCDEYLIKVMKKAGLAGVWLGVQSGSEKVRKEVFKRYYSNKKLIEQAKLFKKHNISVKYDIIFNNPWEPDTSETIKLMRKLPNPKLFNFFSLKYFPNTEITKMALEKGFITQKELDDQLTIMCPEYEISNERKMEILNKVYKGE